MSRWFIDELFPKLPIGQSFRSPILISIDSKKTSFSSPHSLNQQVLAYQNMPKLELVGIGQPHKSTDENIIEVGIFPRYHHRIFRADTTAEFYYESPSLLVLLQKLAHSPQGHQLRSKLTALRQDILERWSRLWPFIRQQLSHHLISEDFERLVKDPIIITSLKISLFDELSQSLHLNDLEKKIAAIPEIKQLLNIATQNLNTSQLAKHTLKGLYVGGKTELKMTSKVVKNLWDDGDFFSDGSHCLGIIFGQSFGWGGQILSRFLEHNESKLCGQIKSSFNQTMVNALTEGGKHMARQAWQNAYQNGQNTVNLGVKATASIAQEINLNPALRHFWEGLTQNQQLKTYILTKYGAKTWAAFKRSISEIADSEQFKRELEDLSSSFKDFLSSLFTAIILNEDGKGPNPLLIMIIQEQLTRIKKPIIWITPGVSDQIVGVGHLVSQTRWR